MNLRFKGNYSLRRLNTVCLLRKPGKCPAPANRNRKFLKNLQKQALAYLPHIVNVHSKLNK